MCFRWKISLCVRVLFSTKGSISGTTYRAQVKSQEMEEFWVAVNDMVSVQEIGVRSRDFHTAQPISVM